MLPNSTDRYRRVIVGSMGTTNLQRTWSCKSRLVSVNRKKISYEKGMMSCGMKSRNKRNEIHLTDLKHVYSTSKNYGQYWSRLTYLNWLGLVRESMHVSSGYHHMWVHLGTKQLISWLIAVVISLTLVPLS
ncbi:hypothetical protein TNCV_1460431 [Trichonephila clavipes]|nr:hypothetical protein TNCV_1460431 [Trichonephila clavipes]